jgi:biopolymer transport protein TolQ
MEHSIWQLIAQAGAIVKLVMLMLLFFSVVSWAIIFFKYRYLNAAARENALFFAAFRKARDTSSLFTAAKKYLISPMASVFRAVYTDIDIESANDEVIRRALKRYETLESAKLERHLGFLATTGSSTPFIGLFGTVWGIMNSFRGIGKAGSASLAVVAPGIAEALIATAMGLVAAIPAVIAYNYYLSRSRHLIIEMEDFSEEILDMFMKEKHEGRT